MSKERLEEIKVVENWDNLNEWQFKAVAWLIEQAENNFAHLKTSTNWMIEALRLEQQNKRYREALERISEHEVYGIDIRCGEELSTDAGKIARQALEDEE